MYLLPLLATVLTLVFVLGIPFAVYKLIQYARRDREPASVVLRESEVRALVEHEVDLATAALREENERLRERVVSGERLPPRGSA